MKAKIMWLLFSWLIRSYWKNLTPDQQAAIKKTIADMPTADEQQVIDDGKKPWHDERPER